jgi:hypothetical protein
VAVAEAPLHAAASLHSGNAESRSCVSEGQAQHRHTNPLPSGWLDFPARGNRSRRSECGTNFTSMLYSNCSGLVRPWSGTKIAELDPTQNSQVKSSSCLVAGAGFEPATFGS